MGHTSLSPMITRGIPFILVSGWAQGGITTTMTSASILADVTPDKRAGEAIAEKILGM